MAALSCLTFIDPPRQECNHESVFLRQEIPSLKPVAKGSKRRQEQYLDYYADKRETYVSAFPGLMLELRYRL